MRHAFGIATTGGTVFNTGVVGLMLGGGLGWLMGKHGLAIDNMISADVVTADGQFRKVSAVDHPDLFWALRGGGGNFGVVTSAEYKAHEVSTVLGGLVLYHLDQARDMMRLRPRFLRHPSGRGRSVRSAFDHSAGNARGCSIARLQRPHRGKAKRSWRRRGNLESRSRISLGRCPMSRGR